MATTFSTFDTTPTGAVAAIKAAILASSDWANPTGQRVVCTTTRGADMVVDLADAAATSAALQVGVYRTAALADKLVRYLQWRGSGSGATTDPLHCTVSAGKEHLFILIEGPRVGEANPILNGSYRALLFLCDLVPYFASDTAPMVVCGGNSSNTTPNSTSAFFVHVSRNAANNSSWVQATLETLSPPRGILSTNGVRANGQSLTAAGIYIARPWVVFEDVAGMRGRLAPFYYLGFNFTIISGDLPVPALLKLTIGAVNYITVATNQSPLASQTSASPFGWTYSNTDGAYASPIVAVPYA
jgi:hypothetical protein